jgi:hypothetical protein
MHFCGPCQVGVQLPLAAVYVLLLLTDGGLAQRQAAVLLDAWYPLLLRFYQHGVQGCQSHITVGLLAGVLLC